MGYTSIYELPAEMRIEQEEIDALFDRIAVNFIRYLAERGLRFYKEDLSIVQTPQGLKFTVTAEGTGFIDSRIFDQCFAQAALSNLE